MFFVEGGLTSLRSGKGAAADPVRPTYPAPQDKDPEKTRS
jgi:hypothetical protein